MARNFDSFEQKECHLAIISSGATAHIKEFREITGFQGNILSDPALQTFNYLGFTSSIGGLLGFKSIAKSFAALREGVKPGLLQGSALQLGGAIVITKEGEICYYYKSTEAGDYPPIDEMLASLN